MKQIPKTDLHVHIDGSLRIKTIIEIAREQKISLPSLTEEGLREKVFKTKYKDLVDYLRGFTYTTAVMQTPEAIERISYEFAIDSFADGVRYVEPRFAPQRHAAPSFSVDDVVLSVNAGLARAKKEINSRQEIRSGKEPPFDYGIICCAMRMFTEEYSGYYKRLTELHPHMPEDELTSIASVDLVRTMICLRDDKGIPIAGFDLAGAEKGYPAEEHKESYHLAHKKFLKKTVHAGEAYGPPSIFQAITDCHADRIGHGTHIFDTSMVDLPSKKERDEYVRSLWEYIADRRITIEICLTSNLQTMPKIRDIKQHPFQQMLEKRLSVSFCTDNRLISGTDVTNEIELAVNNFEIPPRKLKDIIIYGFKRSFQPVDYVTKRHYVRKIIDYYELMEEKYGLHTEKK